LARSSSPEVAPLLSREKTFNNSSQAKKNQSPVSIVLIVAMGVFLIAGISRAFTKPVTTPVVKVISAIKDIPPGCKIGFSNLQYMTIPQSYMRPNLLTSYPELIGKTTNAYIRAGEPVLKDQLMKDQASLSGVLFHDQRAITLKLEEDELVDHSIVNGDVVDIIATSVGKEGKKYTRTLCQSVTVLLSAPKEIVLSDKLKSLEDHKITLAVDPVDAEKLAQAIGDSKLRLVLRSSGNHEKYPLPGADERDLLPVAGIKSDVKAAAAKSLPPISPLPVIAPPPPVSYSPLVEPGSKDVQAPGPLGWMVEAFSGSRKDTYAVSK
jgi:pilus assembly protein CpaB